MVLPPDAKLASMHKSCSPFHVSSVGSAGQSQGCESCSELTLIQRCFVAGSLPRDALQCSGGGLLSWYSDQITYLPSECGRELLSLGVQRLVFNFPLPSAALGSSWIIPGTSPLLPQIPVFWDKPWGRAWSPGVLTVPVLFLVQGDIPDKHPWITKVLFAFGFCSFSGTFARCSEKRTCTCTKCSGCMGSC